MKNSKRYISTFIKPKTTKLRKDSDSGWGAPTYKAICISLWSCGHVMSSDKIKSIPLTTWTLQLHFHSTYKHQTWHSGDFRWGTVTLNHVIRERYVLNYGRFILTFALVRVVANGDELPLTKLPAPLIMWSRDDTLQNKNGLSPLPQNL